MTLKEYQKQAMTTCMPSCRNYSYMMLNLVSEVGELAGLVAKAIRKGHANIIDSQLCVSEEEIDFAGFDNSFGSELGDVLWQLASLCTVMGYDLEEVAKANLAKLKARKENGTIVEHEDH